MDWPAGMPEKAATALNVYKCFKAYLASGGGKDWADRNGGIWYVVTWVKKHRGDYG